MDQLREIAIYFQNPFKLIEVDNIILKCFYNFLLKPNDLEKLLESIGDTDQIFITSAFWGIISGFALLNGREFETFTGSTANFNKMLKYMYKSGKLQSKKPANKKPAKNPAKKPVSPSKPLKVKKPADKKDKLPVQSDPQQEFGL